MLAFGLSKYNGSDPSEFESPLRLALAVVTADAFPVSLAGEVLFYSLHSRQHLLCEWAGFLQDERM